jgi:hypothetical protein
MNNPLINPETGRSIIIGGPTYKKLVKKYGDPDKYNKNLVNSDYSQFIIPVDDFAYTIPRDIWITILLEIEMIEDLYNLYKTSSIFYNILNDEYVLSKLKNKYYKDVNYQDAVYNLKDLYGDKYDIVDEISDCLYNFNDFIVWYHTTRFTKKCDRYYPLLMCAHLAYISNNYESTIHFGSKPLKSPLVNKWTKNDRQTFLDRTYQIISAPKDIKDVIFAYIWSLSDKIQKQYFMDINMTLKSDYKDFLIRYPTNIELEFVNSVYKILCERGYFIGNTTSFLTWKERLNYGFIKS